MEQLDAALTGKTLEDLKVDKPTTESNLLEPTKAEIELILTALKDGKSPQEIKKTIRRVEMDGENQKSAKGFSFDQIKQIDKARLAKVFELTPKPVEEV